MPTLIQTTAIALTLALAAPTTSLAAPVDLSGTWVLDLAASDSIEPMLKAQGVSYMKRKAAASMEVTQTIVQTGDTLSVDVDTSHKDTKTTVKVDGVTREVTTASGEKTQVTNLWKAATWVSTTVMPEHDGGPMTLTRTHALADAGKTLKQRIELKPAQGQAMVVTRLYRRK